MKEIAIATNWLNILLAGGIVAAGLAIGAHITRETRCALRVGVFGIFVGAALHLGGGIWEFGDWAQSILLGGILVYMLANVRQPVALPSASWANRAAWAVCWSVLLVLGATFATAASAGGRGEPAALPVSDCQILARVVYSYAQRRDKGQTLERQRADMLERQARNGSSPQIMGIFSHELELLYAEHLEAKAAALASYKRCAGFGLKERGSM